MLGQARRALSLRTQYLALQQVFRRMAMVAIPSHAAPSPNFLLDTAALTLSRSDGNAASPSAVFKSLSQRSFALAAR